MSSREAAEARSDRRQLMSQKTNLRTFFWSLGFLVVGSAMVLILSEYDWKATGVAVGSGVLAVGALALASDISARRSIVREVFAAAALGKEITLAGMSAIHGARDAIDPEFPDLVSKAKSVDLLFISATGWLTANEMSLHQMLKKKGRIRVLLPEPSDDDLLQHLLTRFDYDTLEELRTDVSHAKNILMTLKRIASENAASSHRIGLKTAEEYAAKLAERIVVKRLRTVPTYSYFRVDELGVIRVHELRKERAKNTPVLVFHGKGSLKDFAQTDFDYLFAAADELQP